MSWRKRVVLGCGVILLLAVAIVAWLFVPFYVRLERVSARPERGFHSDYYLYVPPEITQRVLLVVPNNTGALSDDVDVHRRKAFTRAFDYHRIADQLGTPMLIPIFRRPNSNPTIYTHALDRDTLTTPIPDLRRLDLQLIAMIDDARARLGAIDKRVLIAGFSASGMFADRFTVLHPDRVRAAAVGSPGGWPIAPLSTYAGRPLRYPVGVGDLETVAGTTFDAALYRTVPTMFYVGADDTNDSLAFDDGYDPQDKDVVRALFGADMRDRWPLAEQLHRGDNATFKVYPHTGHKRTDAMNADVVRFFERVLHGPSRP